MRNIGPRVLTQILDLRKMEKHIDWVDTELATVSMDCMDEAAESGKRASAEFLSCLNVELCE